jgi:hypothetical protein
MRGAQVRQAPQPAGSSPHLYSTMSLLTLVGPMKLSLVSTTDRLWGYKRRHCPIRASLGP